MIDRFLLALICTLYISEAFASFAQIVTHGTFEKKLSAKTDEAQVLKYSYKNQPYLIKLFPNSSRYNRILEEFASPISDAEAERIIAFKLFSIGHSLSLPYFPAIFDSGNFIQNKHTIWYLVMEFINGIELKKITQSNDVFYLCDNLLSQAEKIRFVAGIFYQIFHALSLARERLGFYHLDLHPGNIMIRNETFSNNPSSINEVNLIGVPKVTLLDFGMSIINGLSIPDEKWNRTTTLDLFIFTNFDLGSLLVSWSMLDNWSKLEEIYDPDTMFVLKMLFSTMDFLGVPSNYKKVCISPENCLKLRFFSDFLK